MDPVILAGMIFSVVVIAMIGSFVLLYPVSRRLGEALELWLRERRDGSGGDGLRDTREALARLASSVESLEERQKFVEELLEDPGRARPLGGGADADSA